MPKKVKRSTKPVTTKKTFSSRSQNDFFFIVVISVFAALTVFGANYLARTRQEIIQARQQQELPVAQLELIPPPTE